MKPANIKAIHDDIDVINSKIEAHRHKRGRAWGQKRRPAAMLEQRHIDDLKVARSDLKAELRDAKQQAHRLPGQVLGGLVSKIVNEQAAIDYARAEALDQLGQIVSGRRTVKQGVELALQNMAREAHVIFDFTPIPFVGPFIEAYDHLLFAWAVPALRPLVRAAFDAVLKEESAPREQGQAGQQD